jgi:DNA-binding transcriptional LysR family regulator
MIGQSLDLDAVRSFLLVAELKSFTRAAEASDTTQSAVSLKLKRLETQLGRRLFERHPRLVRLTGDGEAFLPRAEELMAAHERALAVPDRARRRLVLCVSDHVAGPELVGVLAQLAAGGGGDLALELRLGMSRELLDAYDRGALDAVVVRRQKGRRDGEELFEDRLGWFAAAHWRVRPGEALRLVVLSSECGVRAEGTRLLERARLPWTEAFVGGGMAAVRAAVAAGFGIAPLARRTAPPGAIDMTDKLGLPKLPTSRVVLHSNVADPEARAALRTMAAAFRGLAAPPMTSPRRAAFGAPQAAL